MTDLFDVALIIGASVSVIVIPAIGLACAVEMWRGDGDAASAEAKHWYDKAQKQQDAAAYWKGRYEDLKRETFGDESVRSLFR